MGDKDKESENIFFVCLFTFLKPSRKREFFHGIYFRSLERAAMSTILQK